MKKALGVDLPKHPVVHGHPVHAILSDGPAVTIPIALAVEVWRRSTNRRMGMGLSDIATTTAAATAAAAATVGWLDWLTMPGEHPAHTPATLHGLINSSGLLALLGAVFDRRRRIAFLTAAMGSLLIGAWIGGDLVFRFGWRVRPAEEAELVEQRLAQDGDHQAFAAARREVADFERRKTFIPST